MIQTNQSLRAFYWLLSGRWKEQPGRLVLAVFAVMLGVALGLAIHLVNRSALSEFSDAIALVNGQAQQQITSTQLRFDETILSTVGQLEGIAVASPVIETIANVRSSKAKIKLLGIDLFRAASVTPELVLISDLASSENGIPLLQADAVFLSAAALKTTGKQVGDTIELTVGSITAGFRIAGRLSQVPSGQVLAVTDIANMQYKFQAADWMGQLSRIDLVFDDNFDRAKTQGQLNKIFAQTSNGATLRLETPETSTQRVSNVSRAYRVNLAVLGLVALIVGGFLVYSTMYLLTQRQAGDAALLALLGTTPRRIGLFVLAQGSIIGLAGSLSGVAGGIAMAQAFITVLGGDLGAGFFNGSTPRLRIEWFDLAGFGLLGLAASIAAAWQPAQLLMRQAHSPIDIITGANQMEHQEKLGLPIPASKFKLSTRTVFVIACLSFATIALTLKPIWNLPIGGFSAMALVLIAAIAVVGPLTHTLALRLAQANVWQMPSLWLASQRLARYPKPISVALGATVASVALACAMAIMVHSFRDSVERWLGNILPADLYLRANANLNANQQALIKKINGIARVNFLRITETSIKADLPNVSVIGRSFDDANINEALPFIGAVQTPLNANSPDTITVYISEAMVDLYGWQAGTTVTSPMSSPDIKRWFVGGIWRDYGRQHGTVAMTLTDLARISPNAAATDAAIWFSSTSPTKEGESPIQNAINELKKLGFLQAAEYRSSESIRSVSLKIFDRSFALTYIIEAIAIAVALFGVASTYAADSLARSREFATLAHLGVASGLIIRQVILEALLALSVAVLWGGIVGVALAWILIRRINPQSFHWSMDFSWPIGLLVGCGATLVILGMASALAAYRSSISLNPVQAIRS